MNAFMYYIRRIDLLSTFSIHARGANALDFLEYATLELMRDIHEAEADDVISAYQRTKLIDKLERVI